MTLHELTNRRRGSLAEDDAGWPDRVLAVAQSLRDELASGDALQDVAARVLSHAEAHGLSAVTGASRIGDQLAGAAVALSGGRLHLATPADRGVLVVDGLLATGLQLQRAVARLRSVGAERVLGIAVMAESEALEACRASTGTDVVALEMI